jgi:hypothetical protein
MTGQDHSTFNGAGGRRGGRRGARPRVAVLLGLAAASLLAVSGVALAARSAFIGPFNTVTTLTSAVPANGDVNPYGIVTVPRSVGQLVAGQLLISNFNNSGNQQGTGTTIDEISPATANQPAGTAHLFATIDPAHLPGPCPGGVGLTTALAALPSGYVVVGSLPTSDGMSDTAMAGCLLVLNSTGHVVETIAGGPIDGPWDMTAVTRGPITTLFVSNVLNNIGATSAPNGTVVRLRLFSFPGHAPRVFDDDVIATGFPTRTDPGALVIGPTGVALSERDTLYVADTLGNRIAAIPDAMDRQAPLPNGGFTVTSGGSLNGPLGLTIAPNDDILTANASDGNIVETTPDGNQLVAKTADSATGAGSLFGLTVAPGTNGVFYVDDGDNTLRLLH